MQILAEVHDVRRIDGDKLRAEVSLIVQEPISIITLMLFRSHEKLGLIGEFEKLKGVAVRVPVEPDIYRGRISYNLSYLGKPQPVDGA